MIESWMRFVPIIENWMKPMPIIGTWMKYMPIIQTKYRIFIIQTTLECNNIMDESKLDEKSS